MKHKELNQRKSWLGAMRADALNKSFIVNDELVIERIGNAIDYEFSDEVKGGIIVFSTDVNTLPLAKNKITENHNISNWSVGNFFKGKYTEKQGGVFTEKSLSVEVIGVTYEQFIEITEDLCREFKQETVLVKSYSTNKILLVT
jgi:hypothetical protein